MAQTTSSESPSGSVEVTQSSGGIGSAVILGVLVGALIVILVVITLINNADDESPTSTVAPGPTVTTLAPDTTAAP